MRRRNRGARSHPGRVARVCLHFNGGGGQFLSTSLVALRIAMRAPSSAILMTLLDLLFNILAPISAAVSSQTLCTRHSIPASSSNRYSGSKAYLGRPTLCNLSGLSGLTQTPRYFYMCSVVSASPFPKPWQVEQSLDYRDVAWNHSVTSDRNSE